VQEVSKLFEGLHALHRAGEIHFSIAPEQHQRHPRVVSLALHGEDGQHRTAAIDLSDQRDLFDSEELARADVYFKRSFWPSAIAELPAALRAKVQPFGLSNPAITRGAAASLLLARLRTGRRPPDLIRDARQLFALPSPRSFEAGPDCDAEPLVLFQTRVWAPLCGQTFTEINEERVRLIRALRAAFGSRFLGGLMPDAFARQHYPDAITQLPCSLRAYPGVMKRALVAVYTRGLHDSVGFKFSEYLAASRCIVGHAPDAVLPKPLETGRHYLEFSESDQCVAHCEAILADANLVRTMRHANWDYYRGEVEPSAHLRNILERSASSLPITG
jgi:hypothetical protein